MDYRCLSGVGKVRKALALDQLADLVAIDKRLKDSGTQIKTVVQWHTDGVHGAGDLPRVWLPIGSAVVDARGIEILAQEIVGSEVVRHRLHDHPERT